MALVSRTIIWKHRGPLTAERVRGILIDDLLLHGGINGPTTFQVVVHTTDWNPAGRQSQVGTIPQLFREDFIHMPI